MTTIDESFGASVAKARTLRGMSQKDFAAALTARGMKIDAPAVSRIEKGQRAVRLAEASLIADALDENLMRLLAGVTAKPEDRLRELLVKMDDAASKVAEVVVAVAELGEQMQATLDQGGGIGADLEAYEVEPLTPNLRFMVWYADALRVRGYEQRALNYRRSNYWYYSEASERDEVLAVIAELAATALVSRGEAEGFEDHGVSWRGFLEEILDEPVIRFGSGDGSPA